MISLARFGPVSTPAGWSGSTSFTTSLMRRWLPGSSPLARLTTGTQGRIERLTSSSTSRMPWEGTPITTTSASRTASSREAVARSPGARA